MLKVKNNKQLLKLLIPFEMYVYTILKYRCLRYHSYCMIRPIEKILLFPVVRPTLYYPPYLIDFLVIDNFTRISSKREVEVPLSELMIV